MINLDSESGSRPWLSLQMRYLWCFYASTKRIGVLNMVLVYPRHLSCKAGWKWGLGSKLDYFTHNLHSLEWHNLPQFHQLSWWNHLQQTSLFLTLQLVVKFCSKLRRAFSLYPQLRDALLTSSFCQILTWAHNLECDVGVGSPPACIDIFNSIAWKYSNSFSASDFYY